MSVLKTIEDILVGWSSMAETAAACCTASHKPGVCWICGDIADSREHRHKRTSCELLFGKQSKDMAVVAAGEGELARYVQGHNSKQLKYPPSLCQQCNNSRSQAGDRAYDTLIAWVHKNGKELADTRKLDFNAIYGGDAETQVPNLMRYLCKEIGCRLHDAGRPIPLLLASAAKGGPIPACIAAGFSINEPLFAEGGGGGKHPRYLGQQNLLLGVGPALHPSYAHKVHFGWLTIFVGYRHEVEHGFGAPVGPSSVIVELGSDTIDPRPRKHKAT